MVKTPADKWKDTLGKYKIQCQQILKLSNNIRYVGVINSYGRTLTGTIKPNLKPLLNSEQVKNEFFIVSTLISMRQANDSSVGKLDGVIFKHSKVNIIILHKKDITFYVYINSKEKHFEPIISKIKKII